MKVFYICLYASIMNCLLLSSSFASGPKDFYDNNFENYIYIHESCENDNNFDIDLQMCGVPKVVIRCFYEYQNYTQNQEEWIPLEGPKQLPRFGPQRYTHIFFKAESNNFINLWKELYGRITLTKFMTDFFTVALSSYKKYPINDQNIFKKDYWRSQWNQDRFIIKDSHDQIYNSLAYNYDQLPTHLQKAVKTYPDPSEFSVLFYSILAGGAYLCDTPSLDQQLKTLTESFNAYNMLFCDVFLFYNLTFKVDYNFHDYQWFRSFIIRDDLMSSFPPDTKAVFYGSPGITFIELKEKPILWTNIFRPFELKVWILIGICCVLDYLVLQLFIKTRIYALNREIVLKFVGHRDKREVDDMLSSCVIKLGRVVLIAAYSGMILVGILDPSYPVSPTTFEELNKTTDYIAATSYHSAVQPYHLIDSKTLNGIPQELWRDRELEKERRPSPGSWLIDDEYDLKHRYALLMFDDKKNYFIYGRSELQYTAKYLHRLETNKESVLREMRYISVAEGATKLHFLVHAIRRCFETGSWMKWKALEDNYFKYVAPNVIKMFGIIDEPTTRVINMGDIISAVYIWYLGIGLSIIKLLVELGPSFYPKMVQSYSCS